MGDSGLCDSRVLGCCKFCFLFSQAIGLDQHLLGAGLCDMSVLATTLKYDDDGDDALSERCLVRRTCVPFSECPKCAQQESHSPYLSSWTAREVLLQSRVASPAPPAASGGQCRGRYEDRD